MYSNLLSEEIAKERVVKKTTKRTCGLLSKDQYLKQNKVYIRNKCIFFVVR